MGINNICMNVKPCGCCSSQPACAEPVFASSLHWVWWWPWPRGRPLQQPVPLLDCTPPPAPHVPLQDSPPLILCQPDLSRATQSVRNSMQTSAQLCKYIKCWAVLSLLSQHAPCLPGCCPMNDSCCQESWSEAPAALWDPDTLLSDRHTSVSIKSTKRW